MLLFLKSEGMFSKENFQEFNELLSWDKSRFERLRQQGWIEVFRKRVGKHRAKYQLSFKAKRVLRALFIQSNIKSGEYVFIAKKNIILDKFTQIKNSYNYFSDR